MVEDLKIHCRKLDLEEERPCEICALSCADTREVLIPTTDAVAHWQEAHKIPEVPESPRLQRRRPRARTTSKKDITRHPTRSIPSGSQILTLVQLNQANRNAMEKFQQKPPQPWQPGHQPGRSVESTRAHNQKNYIEIGYGIWEVMSHADLVKNPDVTGVFLNDFGIVSVLMSKIYAKKRAQAFQPDFGKDGSIRRVECRRDMLLSSWSQMEGSGISS